jgi:hypothetical protein
VPPRTPDDKEREFRKHYLVTGNVAGSAKAVGLPPSTGYELRNRALDDPAFVALRDRIRAKLEPDTEQMAVSAMQLCMERLNVDPDERLARMMAGTGESGKVSFQDPGPQYAASLAKLIQAVMGTRRFESERAGDMQAAGTVVIRVSGPAGVTPGDDDSGD